MGQSCGKPYGGSRCSRLSKVKAEAAAAAEAAKDSDRTQPDPSVVQLLTNNNGRSTTAPGSEPMSSPLSIPQIDAAREVRIAIQTNDPQDPTQQSRKKRRRNSREWLQQQRKRLTKPCSFGQLKKNKVALAHDEVLGSGTQPIIVVEASTMSREASTSCNDSNELLLVGEERIALSSDGPGSRQARYQQGPPLLSPTPRRPMATRFPFLNPATVSVTTTCSSNNGQGNKEPENSQESGAQDIEEDSGDNGDEVAGSNSVTPSTIFAVRRPVFEDGEQRANYGSLHSNSPSIYYLAPSSPQIPAAKERRVSSVPSEARVPSPTSSVSAIEEQGSEVQYNEVQDSEVQDSEVQDSAVQDNNAQDSAVRADTEIDGNFLNAIMAFVASQGQRPQPTSLTCDELRSEILVEGGGSA